LPLVTIASVLVETAANMRHEPIFDLENEPIRLIPTSARKAYALDLARFYRLYELLKHIDRVWLKGTGKFVVSGEILAALAVATRLSETTLRRALRAPEAGLFWQATITRQWRENDVIYLRLASRQRVEQTLSELAEAAGVYDPRRVSIGITFVKWSDCRSLKRFGAACFGAWLAAHNKTGSSMIRWSDLKTSWGRARKQLRLWCKIARVKIIHNRVLIDPSEFDRETAYRLSMDLSREGFYVTTQMRADGKEFWSFQRANTFVAPVTAQVGKRSIPKRATRYLRRPGDGSKRIRNNHPIAVHRTDHARRIKRTRQQAPERDQYLHKVYHAQKRYGVWQGTNLWELSYCGKWD
jgi:hypothetical protein